ncbi:MAG: energy-coupling factor transporter ATP-binding protein [Betaproteobacteria bacterium]|jgi:tungstate transport system ATP-binding protein|nr:energy-coupling factor transporter ATP-binding protein [Betaproteobacteria bacterium]
MSAPLLALRALDKRFGQRVLFADMTLELEAGSGYVLTGSNGSGKTTLLRMAAGLEPAQRGEIGFRSQSAALAAYPEAWRREIVYVHQQPYLFHTTIADNLEYGLKRRGMPAAESAERAREALAWAGLDNRRDVPPQKLSGGEKQRVALARARTLNPTLLLLDEPTANLDGDARKQVLELVTSLCIENHTVVVASHDPEIIRLAILTRLHIREGRIEAND